MPHLDNSKWLLPDKNRLIERRLKSLNTAFNSALVQSWN